MREPGKCALAMDGGTSNTRVRLLRDGAVIASATRPVGVRDVAISGSNRQLIVAVSECVSDVVASASVPLDAVSLVAASGMITSNVGLLEVPHVMAPAGIDELARSVVTRQMCDICNLTIRFVPGIKTLPAGGTAETLSIQTLAEADIMRGEESETIGILAALGLRGPLSLVLPGSHTKLVRVDERNRISGSVTSVAGELMQALAERTILSSSVDWPPEGEPDWDVVELGARLGRSSGLGRGAFVVRLAQVVRDIGRASRTWLLVGVVIGSDWSELARTRVADRAQPLLVGGREPLRTAYARLARGEGYSDVRTLAESDVDAAPARGAIEIALRSLVEH